MTKAPKPNPPKPMDQTDWGLLILLSVLWGGSFFFAGIAVQDLPPLTVVLARVALAAAFLLPLFWIKGLTLPRTLRDWLPFLGMGLLNNALPFGFIFAGQTYVTVGLASVINAATPLFAVLVLACFGAERLTVNRVTGVLLGIAGVAVLKGVGTDEGETIGILLCLAGALSYGFSALWGRRFLSDVPPLKSATCQLLSSSAIMALVVPLIDRPWTLPVPPMETVLSIGALAIFSTAAAYLVFFKILVRAGAGNAMLVTLLIPVSAMLLGIAFLDEPFRWRDAAGAAIIGLGLLFIDGRLVRHAANLFSRPRNAA